MAFITDIEVWIIVLCATTGSIKASIEFDGDKQCIPRLVDVILGIICGVALVHHYTNQLSLGLRALVAVSGGACGALVLETILSLVPNVLKKVIHTWINKFTE